MGRPGSCLWAATFTVKGGDLLLEWADRTRLDGWQLDLVTRDSVRTSNPRVHVHQGLTPNSPGLRQLYAEASIFALPTRGDCYSIASVEAMAAGLPVILSEIGGTGDIIRDGETGFMIRPGDGAALAERWIRSFRSRKPAGAWVWPHGTRRAALRRAPQHRADAGNHA